MDGNEYSLHANKTEKVVLFRPLFWPIFNLKQTIFGRNYTNNMCKKAIESLLKQKSE